MSVATRLVPLVALSALVPLAAAPAVAQQPAPADTAGRRPTSDRPQDLDAVRVTANKARARAYTAPRSASATKTDTPLRDTPQSISVVTRQLIADQAMQGMADVVRYVPGVTMSGGEGHRDQPTIRGNSSTADFYVDGVRDDAQYYRDLYNLERVEALKGSNAMIFGRGGGGGVINRVTKEAGWVPTRAVTLAGGSFDHKRATVDLGTPLGAAAVRLNAMFEQSGVFRDVRGFRRYGVNPTAALALAPNTTVRLGYEYFDDDRAVDRGIPSFQGRPSPANARTFFGNPSVSDAFARVHAAIALVEHGSARGVTIRNRTRLTDYDKFYQNTYPGAVNAAGTQVSLAAYNQAMQRRNLFNQTDVVIPLATGALRHTVLVGSELGRQRTDQVRQTGYFNGTATSFSVPFAAPTVETPVTFRAGATDADNRARTGTASVYAQDQVLIGAHVQAIAGVRYERVRIDYHNNRSGQDLSRTDRLVSPRAGLAVKPVSPLSLYGAYSVSFLPSAGDQFSALTVTAQALEPERFTNREVGVKWDVRPDLAFTVATYRLDRTNTPAPDPADPAKIVQTGAQRTTGVEAGVTGSVTRAWQVAGGLAAQRARIVSTTAAAKAGQSVPLVPTRTLSLWNRYQISPRLGAGVGVIHQARVFAAIDNAVTLPAFTRVDGALFVGLARGTKLQANVENLLDRRYYGVSNGNNNIMPGAPRSVRVSLAAEL